jgi:endonuclease G, mitochondrial
METGEVFALHFGGLYHEKNFCVPAFALSTDARVVDAGVTFAGTASRGPNIWGNWWARADGGELPAQLSADQQPANAAQPPAQQGASTLVQTAGPAGVTIDIPLRITVSLGAAGPSFASAARETPEAQAITEALVEPFHDADYRDRRGYDPNFLGKDLSVPLPTVKDPTILAKTKASEDTLAYQNFSIRMNASRRLAAVCAANVTREQPLRKPDATKDYTRKGLTNLGQNDQEKWFLDPRLDEKFQLPDLFFTKDQGAFDKGHIVRREDAAWGRTYDELRRANGDTFHVTNCSPQIAGFNRSNAGEDNWGDLENVVFSQAASERLCVLAGPVLDPADEVFVGTAGNRTPLRAKIPARFWKIIVAQSDDGLAAFGFVLEQDLADVPLEFTVPQEFVPKMAPLSDIAELAGLVFAKSLLDADQFDMGRGDEIAARGGTRRRKRG